MANLHKAIMRGLSKHALNKNGIIHKRGRPCPACGQSIGRVYEKGTIDHLESPK